MLDSTTRSTTTPADGLQSAPAGYRTLARRLFQPVGLAPLVYARILFAGLMLLDVARYFKNGWIRRYFIEPDMHFTYLGFGWVQPWPGAGMYIHFAVLGVLALCILWGFLYRLAAMLFFLGFTYVFLLEKVLYLNHFYLLILVSLLMVFIPANRAFSVDARLWPRLRARTAPAWTLFLLRFQVGAVYFFGGVAKLTPDWLRGEPMGMWLAYRTDFPLLGRWFSHPWAGLAFSYAGLLLDLLIVPMLLWKRTRLLALAAAMVFHVLNSQLFRIGVFPWFMLGATLLLLPTRWWDRVGVTWFGLPREASDVPQSPAPVLLSGRQRAIAGIVVIFVLIQVLVPLRHWLYPGVVHWTEEGHRFSWHMKLRSKRGTLTVHAHDPRTGRSWAVDLRQHLESWQYRRAAVMPDMILQLARHVADDLRRQGFEGIQVTADARVSLNGRKPQPMIDPAVDLAVQRPSLRPARWILPLENTPPAVLRFGEELSEEG